MGRFQLVATIDMERGISTATGCTTLKDLWSRKVYTAQNTVYKPVCNFCHKSINP